MPEQIAEIPCPVNIQLPRDGGRHPETAADCCYFTSILAQDGRRFGTQVFVILFPPSTPEALGARVRMIVTDLQSGVHYEHLGVYTHGEINASELSLDIRTPGASLSEGADGTLKVAAELPDGTRIDLRGRPTRPVLYNCGSGLFPHMGGVTHQYSLGSVETAGSLLFEGEELTVKGWSWFDRQTMSALLARDHHFDWMGICLSNGDTISLWDVAPETDQNKSWVTVAHIDGSHTITKIAPLVTSGSEIWTSVRGRQYPARWDIDLPFLDMNLAVTQVQLHENDTGSYTGILAVTGSARGISLDGYGFADLIRISST